MEQASSFLALQCECPHCGAIQEVEWVDKTVDGKEEWCCDTCHEEFSYAHPENQYGHAKL